MTRAELLALLDRQGIKYELVEHQPVHTIEEMRVLGLTDIGRVGKNLFLRNDNGKQHYLVFVDCDKEVDLKALRPQIGSSRLSFASDDRLARHLGLERGAVTPFGLLNDSSHAVTWVVDRDLVGAPKVGVHPMECTATVYLSMKDLTDLVNSLGNPIAVVDL